MPSFSPALNMADADEPTGLVPVSADPTVKPPTVKPGTHLAAQDSREGEIGFFDLPLELRDAIYGIVIVDELEDAAFSFDMSPQHLHSHNRFAAQIRPALLLRSICRQIHHEASDMLFKHANIFITLPYDGFIDLRMRKDLNCPIMKHFKFFLFMIYTDSDRAKGEEMPVGLVVLHVYKGRQVWGTQVETGFYGPKETGRIQELQAARHKELERRMLPDCQASLSRLDNGMGVDFVEESLRIIKKADDFSLGEVLGEDMTGRRPRNPLYWLT